jgi:hypothetical protein
MSGLTSILPFMWFTSISAEEVICSRLSSSYSFSYPCNRPWRTIGLWGVEAPTFSLDNRLTDGGEFVSLTRRSLFTLILVLISGRGWVDPRARVRLEGLGQLKKNPMISSGIIPATFWLVASASANYATACPALFLNHSIFHFHYVSGDKDGQGM